MGYTSPERLRRPRTLGRLACRVLGYVGVLFIAVTFTPMWTGLTDRVVFEDCFSQPCRPPQFKTRPGPDGLPHVIGKTTFWRSDALHDLVEWFDILEHFD